MIRVRVPATTANLGPGFDSLGLALDLYNEFSFEEIESGLEIIGCPEKYNNPDNLVYRSLRAGLDRLGHEISGIRIGLEAEIPESRGLGSSAACILGGVLGANKLAGSPLSREEVLALASEIEGHPDNIAPALVGGLVVSLVEGEEVHYQHIEMAGGLKFMALIPDFTVSTREARQVLPETYSSQDSIFNIKRLALLLAGLVAGDFDLIGLGLEDRIHQPYRQGLINNYQDIREQAEELGALGVFISGAGPTIMAIVREEDQDFQPAMAAYLAGLEDSWEIRELRPEVQGAI